jgi:hypothetical protein
VCTLEGVFLPWPRKSRAGEQDPRTDTLSEEWRREATVQELERVLWRVGVLTATAHELVEDIEVPGSELSPSPAVLSDARDLVKALDAHERERDLWPPSSVLLAAQVCGLGVAAYAIFIDRLTNVGLLVAALGLLLIRRALGAQGWRA